MLWRLEGKTSMGLVFLWVPTWASAWMLVQHADAEVWVFSNRGHFALSVCLPLSALEQVWTSTVAFASNHRICHNQETEVEEILKIMS